MLYNLDRIKIFLGKNSLKGRCEENAAGSVPDLNEGLLILGKVFRLQKRQ